MKRIVMLFILAAIVGLSGNVFAKDEIRTDPDEWEGWFDGRDPEEAPELAREGWRIMEYTREYLGIGGVYQQDGGPITVSNVDCFNCHADSGRKPFADPLYQSSSKFKEPKYYRPMNVKRDLRDRIAWCTANCGGGVLLDRDHPAMDAMVAYIVWLGEGITDPEMQEDWTRIPGISRVSIRGWMDMQADPQRGKRIYRNHCAKCHSKDGPGQGEFDKRIPPLWGDNAVTKASAGGYIVPGIAGWIVKNMPLGDEGTLSPQDALDVAGYLATKPHRYEPHTEAFYTHTGPEGLPNYLYKHPAWYVGELAPGDPFSELERQIGPWRPIDDWQKAQRALR